MASPGRKRDRGICRGCGSRQRHRHLWLYLTRETDLLSSRQSLLHFAPEPGIAARLRRALEHYTTADLVPGAADVTLDITRIDLPTASFDVVLCLHVLEHVEDDAAAMRELHRVMRPGGWGILQVPMWGGATIEDPSKTSPEERLKTFGQGDHVRLYGRDYLQRLEAAGFEVEVVVYKDQIPERERRRFGLYYDVEAELGIDLNATREPWEIWRASRPPI